MGQPRKGSPESADPRTEIAVVERLKARRHDLEHPGAQAAPGARIYKGGSHKTAWRLWRSAPSLGRGKEMKRVRVPAGAAKGEALASLRNAV